MPSQYLSLEIKEIDIDGFEFSALTDGERVYQVYTDKLKCTFSNKYDGQLNTISGYVVYQTGDNKTIVNPSNLNLLRIKYLGGKMGDSELYFVRKKESEQVATEPKEIVATEEITVKRTRAKRTKKSK